MCPVENRASVGASPYEVKPRYESGNLPRFFFVIIVGVGIVVVIAVSVFVVKVFLIKDFVVIVFICVGGMCPATIVSADSVSARVHVVTPRPPVWLPEAAQPSPMPRAEAGEERRRRQVAKCRSSSNGGRTSGKPKIGSAATVSPVSGLVSPSGCRTAGSER